VNEKKGRRRRKKGPTKMCELFEILKGGKKRNSKPEWGNVG